MALKDIIRRRREELGLSTRALGARLGVNQSAISHWENGGGITPANLAALARELDLDLAALMAEGPHSAQLVEHPDELAVLAAWRGLPADMRATLLRMMLGLSRPGAGHPGIGPVADEPEPRRRSA